MQLRVTGWSHAHSTGARLRAWGMGRYGPLCVSSCGYVVFAHVGRSGQCHSVTETISCTYRWRARLVHACSNALQVHALQRVSEEVAAR
jgi:hypothetical protein